MSLDWLAGEKLTAAKMNARQPLEVVKATTETLASNTTLQNDDELFLDLAAGRTYEVEAHLGIAGDVAGDIKVAWSTTGSITLLAFRDCLGPALATANISDTTVRTGQSTLGTTVSYGTAAGTGRVRESFVVSCTAAGRLQLQWAQNTSNAVVSSVGSGSFLIATPVA